MACHVYCGTIHQWTLTVETVPAQSAGLIEGRLSSTKNVGLDEDPLTYNRWHMARPVVTLCYSDRL